MQGALPRYISLAMIAEEGLPFLALERIIDSIASQARRSGVAIVTGDFKVVEKGACDKLFITTAGVGDLVAEDELSTAKVRPGDAIIVTGQIGRHGLAVLTARKNMDVGFRIKSDCAALHGLVLPLLRRVKGVRFMRDPTRGGLATVLNEVAEATQLGAHIYEKEIPLSSQVKVACELLGMDPLYLANEGVAVIVVAHGEASRAIACLKKYPLGRNARVVGSFLKKPAGRVVMTTVVGTQRIVDTLSSDPLPRIC